MNSVFLTACPMSIYDILIVVTGHTSSRFHFICSISTLENSSLYSLLNYPFHIILSIINHQHLVTILYYTPKRFKDFLPIFTNFLSNEHVIPVIGYKFVPDFLSISPLNFVSYTQQTCTLLLFNMLIPIITYWSSSYILRSHSPTS